MLKRMVAATCRGGNFGFECNTFTYGRVLRFYTPQTYKLAAFDCLIWSIPHCDIDSSTAEMKLSGPGDIHKVPLPAILEGV